MVAKTVLKKLLAIVESVKVKKKKIKKNLNHVHIVTDLILK